MVSLAAKDAIYRARTRLLISHPFYGFICQRLKLREDESIPTMATDSQHLFYNPDFFIRMTKPQQEAALAHEVEHVFLEHIPRAMALVSEADHEKYWPTAMIAMDMAINPHLQDGGFQLIKDAVFPPKEHWNESFEQHFKRLKKNAKTPPKPKCNGGCEPGTGKGGDKSDCKCPPTGGSCSGTRPLTDKDGKALSPAEVSAIRDEMKVTITKAYTFAKAAGNLPGFIERMMEDITKPRVSWKDVLRRFMTNIVKRDYRMTPPNRRYIHQNIYLPSLRSEAVGTVAVYLDGSGSTATDFPEFLTELASVMEETNPERVIALCWDTRCTWEEEYDEFTDNTAEALMEKIAEMGAGGGTCFTDCFKYLEERYQTTPQVAIVITDMEFFGEWPEDPGYPVLWVSTTDIVGPYGETIHLTR